MVLWMFLSYNRMHGERMNWTLCYSLSLSLSLFLSLSFSLSILFSLFLSVYLFLSLSLSISFSLSLSLCLSVSLSCIPIPHLEHEHNIYLVLGCFCCWFILHNFPCKEWVCVSRIKVVCCATMFSLRIRDHRQSWVPMHFLWIIIQKKCHAIFVQEVIIMSSIISCLIGYFIVGHW